MLDPTPDGQLTVEIYGYDTYDPTTRTVQPSDGDDIDSWMVDTAHDGKNFFPRLFYAPAAKNPRKYLALPFYVTGVVVLATLVVMVIVVVPRFRLIWCPLVSGSASAGRILISVDDAAGAALTVICSVPSGPNAV